MTKVLNTKSSLKTTGTKKPETKQDEMVAGSENFTSIAADTISVKIKKNTQYSSDGIELLHSHQLTDGENVDETFTFMIDRLSGIANAYIEQFVELSEPQEVQHEEPEPDELTKRRVLLMDRDELLEVIKQFELGVNPKKIKKLAELRDAVADVLFPETTEGTEEADTAEGTEEAGITEDQIREMERDELVALIDANELDINPKKYKKIADLAEAIIALMQQAGAEEGVEEGGEGITEDQIREMERDDLIALIDGNELDINPKKYKKTADLAEAVIAAVQAANDEGGADDENTLTVEKIREMDRDELEELINTHELDINPKKYKKVEELVEKIIEVMSVDSEEVKSEFDDTDFNDKE